MLHLKHSSLDFTFGVFSVSRSAATKNEKDKKIFNKQNGVIYDSVSCVYLCEQNGKRESSQ